MNKLVLLLVLGLTGAASAQPAPAAGSAAAGSAAAGSAAAQPAPPPEPTPAPAGAIDAQKVCVDALNADPELAKRVGATYNKKALEAIDQQTIDAHKRAAADIAENERHVIYAYAAMWIFAALFLVHMWRRQQALKTELAQLRRELDAAAKETK
jgi:hypothetical protein